MTYLKYIKVFILMVLFGFVNTTTPLAPDNKLTLVNSIKKFSNRFYNATTTLNPDKSIIVSPLSAELILTYLSYGCRKETLSELNRGLFFPDNNFAKSEFKPLLKNLHSIEKQTIKIANKIYVKKGSKYVLDDDFKKNGVEIFATESENIDFTDCDKAADTMNNWIKEKTNGFIKDVIQPEMLNDMTRAVLVNAIYFESRWDKFYFEDLYTKQADFYVTPTEKIRVQMMKSYKLFRYGNLPELDAQAVELFYKGRETSMLLILPNKMDGLKNLEEKLANADLKYDVLDRMIEEGLTIKLPKFQIEIEVDLRKLLPEIGITSIFDESRADLSGMLKSKEDLYVSSAVQKAVIIVDEAGTKAAAASVAIPSSRVEKQFLGNVINFNHPFYFAIMNRNDFYPIFIGSFKK